MRHVIAKHDKYAKLAAAFVVLNALVWWALYSFGRSSLDTYGDMAEAYSWGTSLQWGYDKHPPLSAWTAAAWFHVFPTSDWAYYLLAVVNQGVAFWFIFLAGRRWLPPAQALLAVMLTSLIPLFGPDTGFKFNANSAMLPWVAIFSWSLITALQTGLRRYVVLAGIAAGAACLVKYWAVLMLASIALGALLITAQHRSLLRPLAMRKLFFVAGIAGLVFTPHFSWAVIHHWPGLNYAHASHAIANSTSAVGATLGVLFDLLLVALLPTLAWSLGMVWVRWSNSWPQPGSSGSSLYRPRLARMAAGASIFLGALVATLASAHLAGVAVASKWLIPAWLFFSWFLCTALPEKLNSQSLIRPLSALIGIYWLGLAVYVASVSLSMGLSRETPNLRNVIANKATMEFHHLFGQPLRYIAGNEALAFSTSFYSTDHPVAIANLDFNRTSWLIEADVRKAGLVVLCNDLQPTCMNVAIDQLGVPINALVLKRRSGEGSPATTYALFYAPTGGVQRTST